MQTSTLSLIVASVAITAVAQVLLKIGMSQTSVGGASHARAWGRLVRLLVSSPWVVSGMCLYVLGAVVWLLVLAEVELSFAYPFVGMGFVMTLLLSWWLLKDTMSVQRVVGTLLISAGVVLVAKGG
jgi:drug/metabolite transporter (DMT)-like permease